MKILLTAMVSPQIVLTINEELKRVYYNPLTGQYSATPDWFGETEIQIGQEFFRVKLQKVIK